MIRVFEVSKKLFFFKDKKSLRKNIYLRNILENVKIFLDHTNMPNFHQSSLDSHTTPKKGILNFFYFFFENLKVFETE